jgi:Phage T7 tail fibre protein
MAYSYVEYVGDGATKTFTVPFVYANQNEVSVFVDGTEYTDFSFTSDSSLALVAAPPNGAVVRVSRTSNLTDRAVDFSNGSVLSEEDLDNALIQVFNAAQEAVDKSNEALFRTPDGKWDAQNRVIKNLADAVDDGDAVSKGYLGYEYPKVATVADNINSVNTVSPSIANVNTTAANIASVNTTASNIANVNKVAAIDANVTKVANIDANVVTVAGNNANVTTVAQSIAGVNTTAGSIANVNTTATNIGSVNTTAGSITNVNRVGDDIASVNTVAGIADAVVTVATNEVDVQLLADEIVKVQTVANDLNEAVSEIEVVANNITTVEIVANNIQAVNDAYANATTAITKAAEASVSQQAAAASAAQAEVEREAAEDAADRADAAAAAMTSNTVIPTEFFTANGTTDEFTFTRPVGYPGTLLVEVAGVIQAPIVGYTTPDSYTLKLSEVPPAGTLISVRYLDKESTYGAAVAQDWASADRNVYVTDTTEYSSKHYALVSRDAATESEDWAHKDHNQTVDGTYFSAKHYSIESADSAADSAASAAAALASQNAAAASEENAADSAAAAAADAARAELSANAMTSNTVIPAEYFTGDGTQKLFTITRNIGYPGSVLVEVAGVLQKPIYSYVVPNATTIEFLEAPLAGSVISVRYLDKESQTGAAIALEWASKDRNQLVAGSSEYSAKHYALNSADSATASANSAAAALASQQAALQSEQNADTSEAFALQYKNEAQSFRNEAQAFAAAAGGAANSTPVAFTGNGSQTDFALTSAAQNNQSIMVFVNTVMQDMFTAYTLVDSGSTLRFDQAPPSGARIVVRYL